MSIFKSGSFLSQVPPVTKNLLIINVLIWAVEMLAPGFGITIVNKLGLHYIGTSVFNPAQVVTYMFVHDNHSIMHIFFNMFTLWMFGRLLERIWGSRRFLIFYSICGIGAAFVQELVWSLTIEPDYIHGIARQNGLTVESMRAVIDEANATGDGRFAAALAQYASQHVIVGASGAIFGLLLGFAFVFPDMPMYLFFIPVPIKAKWMVAGYAVIELMLGVSPGIGGPIAHFAHLGGLLFALPILLYWKKKGTLRGGTFY